MDDQELEYEELDRLEVTSQDDEEDVAYQGNLEDEKIERKEKIATEKAFGLDSSHTCVPKVSTLEARALRLELAAEHDTHEMRAILVSGVDGMHDYQILKVFAAFSALNASKLNESTAIVQFAERQSVVSMMLNMTKMIKRVRGKRMADEDGELPLDDEIEEGQIMYEKGDDVEIVDNLKANEKGIVDKSKDYVTVDVSVKKIPDGKWRVVIQHVPADKFLLVRYPTCEEYDRAEHQEEDSEEKHTRKRQKAGAEFWTHESKNRGGLNMFDKDGNELEWDYQHDTRFYEEKAEPEQKKEVEEKKFELPKGIKVRGRGAVKCGFLFSGADSAGASSSSLASDDQKEVKRKKQNSEDPDMYEKDDVLSRVTPRGLEGRISFR